MTDRLQAALAALKSLIAYTERQVVANDDAGRKLTVIEYEGDLPIPLIEARLQAALIEKQIGGKP